MGGEGGRGSHPDSPSGRPYSAPAGEPQPLLFDRAYIDTAGPGPTYFSQARAGYDGPNNLSWPNTLPPPIGTDLNAYENGVGGAPGTWATWTEPSGGDGGGGNRRTLVAALVLAAVLVVVAAYCVTRAVVGGPLFGGPL